MSFIAIAQELFYVAPGKNGFYLAVKKQICSNCYGFLKNYNQFQTKIAKWVISHPTPPQNVPFLRDSSYVKHEIHWVKRMWFPF